MCETILLLLQLNPFFKNPLGIAGKCIVTQLKMAVLKWITEQDGHNTNI